MGGVGIGLEERRGLGKRWGDSGDTGQMSKSGFGAHQSSTSSQEKMAALPLPTWSAPLVLSVHLVQDVQGSPSSASTPSPYASLQ